MAFEPGRYRVTRSVMRSIREALGRPQSPKKRKDIRKKRRRKQAKASKRRNR